MKPRDRQSGAGLPKQSGREEAVNGCDQCTLDRCVELSEKIKVSMEQ